MLLDSFFFSGAISLLLAQSLVACGSESSTPKGDVDGTALESESMDDGLYTAAGARLIGRVDNTHPNAPRFAWQGAGIVANVEGTEIAVELQSSATNGHDVYFQSIIDGTPGDRFSVAQGEPVIVTLATGLADGEHSVELYRDTEGAYGITTFFGFTSGTVTGAPEARERFIEVVGDSISAGYGNLGSELHPGWVADPACHFSTETSSWYQSYAAIAGRALEAEVSTIARSGWGMVRDNQNNASNVLPRVYDNAVGPSDDAVWSHTRKASAVVINLGTNDQSGGDPGGDFETAYRDFLDTVRRHHPDSWLVLAIGPLIGSDSPIMGYLQAVVSAEHEAGDERISLLNFGTQNLGSNGEIPSGCDWHPSTAEHERMAGLLQTELELRLNW